MVSTPTTPDGQPTPLAITSDLAQALAGDQFFLVYQPEIDLQTNAFAGVEALIRWRHPEFGVVNPELFIPLLEASGDIVPVGLWAITTASHQGAEWHARGYRFTVSVNISAKQFEHAGFVRDLEDVLSKSQIDPAQLVLEFSHQALARGGASARDRLVELKSYGVQLAVDDFAPVDNTLGDLETFPIDIVKLDREFIAGLADTSQSATIVHSLVQLAKTLGLQIVASGIEDADQRRRLQIEEVSLGQGFHFSKPHEVEEIDRFLMDFAIFSGKPL